MEEKSILQIDTTEHKTGPDTGGGGLLPHQIFEKLDLLGIETNSEKVGNSKKIQTS